MAEPFRVPKPLLSAAGRIPHLSFQTEMALKKCAYYRAPKFLFDGIECGG
jgi:hypothetical protein